MFTPKDRRAAENTSDMNAGQHSAPDTRTGIVPDAGFGDDFSAFSDDFDDSPVMASPEEQAAFIASTRRTSRGRQQGRRQFNMPQAESADETQQQPAAAQFAESPAEDGQPIRQKFTPNTSGSATPAQSAFGSSSAAGKPVEIMEVEGSGSLFGQLKVKASNLISGRTAQNEEDFYTPPDGYVSNRIRYRMRNHRPIPIWLKTTALAVGIVFALWVLISLIFFGMMVGQVNYVDSESHAPVRLTLDESAAMQAQLSEEVTNDITLPTLAVRTNKNIQIILLAGVNNAIGSGDAGECDALILVAIDHEHDKIKLVSIARELYAQIPDYRNNMIGEAFFYDSANGNRALDILRQTVETNLCIKIDNIVSIDYDALQVIVNKLGGITMTLTNEEALYMSTDPKYGYFPRYTAGGIYTLTGAEMLNYLRMLNIGEKTDSERVVRMREVLRTIYSSVGETPAIDRTAAIYSVLPYITTDMSSYEVYKIVTGAGRLADYEFTGYSLPVNGSWDYDKVDINGEITEVVVANYSFNAEYLQKFIYDDDLTYTSGNSTNGVDVPYISEEAKAAALAETAPES